MGNLVEKPATAREVGEKVQLHLGLDSAKTKDLGNGVFEAVITTSSIDRYNESIDTSGIDTANYMNNPVVLYGHDYDSLPIGKTIKLNQMKNKIKAQFQLAVDEYPFAATVAAMIKSGYLNAVSIGGRVLEWSEDYRSILKMEMVEFSVVPVPANQEALITARDFENLIGKSHAEVRSEYQNMAKKIMLDKLKDMPENELKDAIKVLLSLTARLEETLETSLNDDKPLTQTKRYVLKDAKRVAEQSQKVIKIVKLS
jgi:HK97 family phage prohead protease